MLFQGKFTEGKDAFDNRITKLFGIQYPIIQAGMIWASGWRLASAVSNAGGLGLIGAGSMYPETLREHIRKCKAATHEPFGVNLPLLYPDIDKHIAIIIEEKVPIVFTSAGNPKTWTSTLKEHGIKVVHVVSSSKFARKCQEAGVDAVVAEGFEAGGHNGREETTTLCLIPSVRKAISIPLIAAGGIATGRAMYSMMALGAEGVQVGSRFVCTPEASSHEEFKNIILAANEGDTVLTLKELTPVRLIKNEFYKKVQQAEDACASKEELEQLLGRGRAKKGMFEGDLEEGELEIGQVSSLISSILPAGEVVKDLWDEFIVTAESPFRY
ncbi:MAG: nitronate monooxygenase [Bacteroidetes bacterium]|nr:nitronate monooxygenase [Bacteroidota bacterium]